MIQRIQSIYLFLASLCGFGLFGLPFASTEQAIASSQLFASDAQYTISDSTGVLVLFIGAALAALAAIFLFKQRLVQIRIAVLAVVLNILGLLLSFWVFMKDAPNMGEAPVEEQFGLGLPALFIVFGMLAVSGIRKDEKLVKSMDRLR